MALLAMMEPISVEEALKHSHWVEAMEEELRSIKRNKTWSLTKLPTGKKAIVVKWIFKTKLNSKGEVTKFKARLVAKGLLQRQGLDYDEVFAPVARLETVRLVIEMTSYNCWEVHQMDVKSAFLNGSLEEEVFVTQPLGFVIKGKEREVYKLHKALYGLK